MLNFSCGNCRSCVLHAGRAKPGGHWPRPDPLRVAIVGWRMGMWRDFFPHCRSTRSTHLPIRRRCFSKYKKRSQHERANMIEKTHPQAVLVYTSIARAPHAIEIAAQYGVS
jgi:hypothetical protein